MNLVEAYKSLTEEAKRQAIKSVLAGCKASEVTASKQYVASLLRGCRKAPCSLALARVVSAHFTGYIGISVTPDEVLACFDDAKAANDDEQAARAA